jgi:phosphoribosyl 1,2-cyclic phosphate phosphodiesterase
VFPEEIWDGFRRFHQQFDIVVLDHTYGPDEIGTDHLSAHQLIDHVTRFRAEGFLKPNARIFATHIAHEGNPAHPILAAYAKNHGYEVAYDGLSISL